MALGAQLPARRGERRPGRRRKVLAVAFQRGYFSAGCQVASDRPPIAIVIGLATPDGSTISIPVAAMISNRVPSGEGSPAAGGSINSCEPEPSALALKYRTSAGTLV